MLSGAGGASSRPALSVAPAGLCRCHPREDNVGAAAITLPDEEFAALDRAGAKVARSHRLRPPRCLASTLGAGKVAHSDENVGADGSPIMPTDSKDAGDRQRLGK
jgi:hypothetical protein